MTLTPDFDAEYLKLNKELDELMEKHETRSYNHANRWRWVVLGLNLAAVAGHLMTWGDLGSWIGAPFNLAVGIGMFVFLTKQRNKIIQKRALRKLTGKTFFESMT